MNKSIFNMSLFFLLIIFLSPIESQRTYAQTNIPPGDVSGTWTQGKSPYNINGVITIPNDSTLTIEPGVEVVFTGNYEFKVQGRLLAIGTETDTIVFTIDDTTGFHIPGSLDGGWGGMKLRDIATSNDSTIFEYCSFQYAKSDYGGAIHCRLVDKLRISHCLFRNNISHRSELFSGLGGAIYIAGGNPVIEYCEFCLNKAINGSALAIASLSNSSDAIIRNNYFHHNNSSAPIIICLPGSPTFINNLIEENHSNNNGILFFFNSVNAKIINNTIVNNTCSQGAILVSDGNPIFINNIVYGNEPSQVHFGSPSSVGFYNCLIEGGKEGFTGATFTGAYENCIDADPQFMSSIDYHLQDNSPCIGAAIDSVLAGSTMYYCPLTDIEGNPRPNPSGSMPDIGAYENELPVPIPVELTLFTASTNGKEVILNWSTATEINNQGFEVERKQNNSGWVRIGFVEGHGTTTESKNYSYIDDIDGINANLLAYRLKQIDYDGSFEYSDVVYIDNLSPTEFVLHQNFPNPFNPSTKIKYSVPQLSQVVVKVFDVLGNEIETLVNEEKPTGTFEITWSAANLPSRQGSALTSGVYFYQLKVGEFVQTKKMLLLK